MAAKKYPCGKTRPAGKPYEIWQGNGWEWNVLKKYSLDDAKPYARWFCLVKSPIVPEGELGDVYVADIKAAARLAWRDPALEAAA